VGNTQTVDVGSLKTQEVISPSPVVTHRLAADVADCVVEVAVVPDVIEEGSKQTKGSKGLTIAAAKHPTPPNNVKARDFMGRDEGLIKLKRVEEWRASFKVID
jgi:hypothetical protein